MDRHARSAPRRGGARHVPVLLPRLQRHRRFGGPRRGAIRPSESRSRSASASRWRSRRSDTSPAATSTRRVPRPRRGAEVPAEGGRPVLDRAARRRLRRRSRGRRGLLGSAVDALDTAPGVGISNGGALLLELIATALFVIVICTVATDDRAPWKGVMAPLLIGLFIFTAADGSARRPGLVQPREIARPRPLQRGLRRSLDLPRRAAAGGMIGGAIWMLFSPLARTSRRRFAQPAACRRPTLQREVHPRRSTSSALRAAAS